ncbi:MAG: TetR family transcriptional regulator [Bacteroidetes bacterium B1(2017)]|nr:MAG: TetR family transcriptional regulator [Bacteroidetes bacterium B1(2017)]
MAKKLIVAEELTQNTEEKIKSAARKVFMSKGLAATRTRDIAEEAGINLALLNYYFRSKDNLFTIVMLESMQQFMKGVKGIVSNEELSLHGKVDALVEHYMSLLLTNPDLPMFILSELRQNSGKIASTVQINKAIVQSHFFKQIKQEGPAKVHPIHFFMNLIGLCVFPYLAEPMLKIIGDLDDKGYQKLLLERKKLVSIWMKQILEK